MPPEYRRGFRDVTSMYAEIFTKAPGRYNGEYGCVNTGLEFATTPTPNSKVYMPSYSEKQPVQMGELMDRLMDYGVLQRPEDVGISPIV